jgi:hypothetical protein
VVVLDTIAVFPRRELRSQPFARVDAIARALNCNLIRARRIGDLKDFLGQKIAALFPRARVHVGKVFALSRVLSLEDKDESIAINVGRIFWNAFFSGRR